MSYTFNLEVVNVIHKKLINIKFAEGSNSMQQVDVNDWFVSNIVQITKTDEQLKDTDLIGLVYEACRSLLGDRDFGIVILGVGSYDTYKFFIKDFISSDQAGRFFYHLHNSRNVRKTMFENSIAAIKEKVSDPEGNFDKNDLYGWCTPGFRNSYNFDIKIFPYPLPDVVTNYAAGVYTYNINGLTAPYLAVPPIKPIRTHTDVLENIKNRYMQLFFPTLHELGNHPNPEKNIDSAIFQKKYLKYKKKYLQLKNNFN
jgi:hypothetical protein